MRRLSTLLHPPPLCSSPLLPPLLPSPASSHLWLGSAPHRPGGGSRVEVSKEVARSHRSQRVSAHRVGCCRHLLHHVVVVREARAPGPAVCCYCCGGGGWRGGLRRLLLVQAVRGLQGVRGRKRRNMVHIGATRSYARCLFCTICLCLRPAGVVASAGLWLYRLSEGHVQCWRSALVIPSKSASNRVATSPSEASDPCTLQNASPLLERHEMHSYSLLLKLLPLADARPA